VSYWDIDHVKATSEVPIKAKLNCIDISPSGRLLAAGSEECTVKGRSPQIYVLDTESRSVVMSFEGHSLSITKIKWITDSLFASSSIDGTIFVWRV
jgi:WD40 repeat protein